MALSPFGQAFADARKAGKSTFTFEGKTYGTKLADEVRPRSSGPSTRGRGMTTTPGYQADRSEPSTRGGARRPAAAPAPEPVAEPKRDPMSSEAARRSRAAGNAAAAKDAWWNNEDRSKRDEMVERVISTSDDKRREDDVAGYSKGGLVQHKSKIISTPKSKKYC